jgi:hypothetical protein
MTGRSSRTLKRSGKRKAAGRHSGSKKSTNRTGRGRTAAKPTKEKRLDPVACLELNETKQLVNCLRDRHPELAGEINDLAVALLETVDVEKLATELGDRLRALDLFDATDPDPRSPRYVAPWESAQHTLDSFMKPYIAGLERRIELGLRDAAEATCLGVVLGLHHARETADDGDSLLAHAPDFCANEAEYVVELLGKRSGRLHRRRWSLSAEAESRLPDWSDLFKRRARRKR